MRLVQVLFVLAFSLTLTACGGGADTEPAATVAPQASTSMVGILFTDAPTDDFEAILLDLKMPGMDGLEVLEHVQTLAPQSVAVMMTGFATVETAIGGRNVTQTIEGRERFPVNVRYALELREDPERLGRVLVPTPSGAPD